jgi:hypothetical protein
VSALKIAGETTAGPELVSRHRLRPGRAARGRPGRVGVQIVGPRWSELRLLEIARRLEEAGILPGFWPPSGY